VKFKGLPTSLGSLPLKDEVVACNVVLENLKEIPAWPQLPQRSFKENMYVQFAYNLPGVKIDAIGRKVYLDTSENNALEEFYSKLIGGNLEDFAYERDYFAGFYEMLSRKEELKEAKAIKGQITGPISMGLQLVDQEKRSIIYNKEYYDLLVQNLKMMATWQERKLEELVKDTILVVDEPYLTMVGSAFVTLKREEIIQDIKEVTSKLQGLKGLHCCGNTDWSIPLESGIDVLSFDTYDYGHILSLYAEKIQDFLSQGGAIAWGIVPWREDLIKNESPASLLAKLEDAMKNLVKRGVDEGQLFEQSLITPTCGLSALEVMMTARVMKLLREVSGLYREKYF